MRDNTAIKRAGRACALLLALTFPPACDDAGRAGDPQLSPGIVVITTGAGEDAGSTSASSTSTSGADDASSTTLPSLPAASTGEADSTGGEDTSTGDVGTSGSSSSTGEASTGENSTGDGSSSGGESTGDEPPPPSVCGDGVCDEAEAAVACWGPGWCAGDCAAEPKCLTTCPCTDGADNVCDLAPGTCPETKPGGLCDPDGDGAYLDGDFFKGSWLYTAKCG